MYERYEPPTVHVYGLRPHNHCNTLIELRLLYAIHFLESTPAITSKWPSITIFFDCMAQAYLFSQNTLALQIISIIQLATCTWLLTYVRTCTSFTRYACFHFDTVSKALKLPYHCTLQVRSVAYV